MGKKIVIKGADFSENGFSLDVVQFAIKDVYFKGASFYQMSGRGMICINVADATVPFQDGYGYSAIEVPDGATTLSFTCNQKYGLSIIELSDGVKTVLVDSGWRAKGQSVVYDLTQYPTAFYLGISLDAVGSVAVEDIAWTLSFE